MKRYSLLLILGALFMVWGDDSWAARTTRDLVFDDEEPAQTQAMGFYKKLGYIPVGGEYLEEFCPHITMIKDLQ